MVNIDHAASKATVGTETGKNQQSTGTCNLALPHLLAEFPIKGHLITGLRHNLIGVGPLCDTECAVTFTREAVIVCNTQGTAVITGWRETTCTRLWRIELQPGESNLPSMLNNSKQATLTAYSAYEISRVATLIRYFHAAPGYPVRYKWIKSIGDGN